MENQNLYYNKIVKQGNSLCVRIPLKISKKLNLSKGTVIAVNLININRESKKLPKEIINSYKSVMKKFSIEEIREFLNYYAIETTTHEKLKINKKYQKFKGLIKNKEIKEKIRKKIKKRFSIKENKFTLKKNYFKL